MQDVNRLKIVLVDSKWCTNSSQPDIETLAKIAKLLNVGVEELYNKKFMDSVLS